MSRYIDSFIKFYEMIYRDIHKNLDNFYRIKCYKINNSNNNCLYNIISAFDNEYNFNNYCCFCFNPKLNDIFIKIECGHEMHYCCFNNFIKYNKTCPFCKCELSLNDTETYNTKEDNGNSDIFINNYKIYELYYK